MGVPVRVRWLSVDRVAPRQSFVRRDDTIQRDPFPMTDGSTCSERCIVRGESRQVGMTHHIDLQRGFLWAPLANAGCAGDIAAWAQIAPRRAQPPYLWLTNAIAPGVGAAPNDGPEE
jgi:hypothetical protein